MDVPDGLFEVAFADAPGSVAILDDDGVIIAVNEEWRRFGHENDMTAEDAYVGENYLTACRSASDDRFAREATTGIESLLDGDTDRFDLEYPCHLPDRKRWFLLRGSGFEHDGDPYALVSHHEVTRRKAAELEVRRRNEELADFLQVLAHDVRNPLAVAQGWLEELPGEPETKGRIEKALDRIDDAVETVLGFVSAEVEADEHREVDVGTRAREIWTTLAPPEATLAVDATRTVRCYPSLFNHLLENLFVNAIRHAGEDVTLTVSDTDEGFAVADDGPGILRDERESVFETGFTTSKEGTGFGLAVVRTVAERHGWSVDVEEAPTGGARFTVQVKPGLAAVPDVGEDSAPPVG